MSQIFTSTDLASYMNTTLVDSTAQFVVSTVNQWIETRTQRFWGVQQDITDERHDWAPIIWTRYIDVDMSDGSMVIQLGYPNLTTTTLDNLSFFWNEWGRVTMYLQTPLEFNPSAINNDLVQITYKSGVVSVPDDLQGAALGIAEQFYNWVINGGHDLTGAQAGQVKLTYFNGIRGYPPSASNTSEMSSNTVQAYWNIIDQYKLVRM